MIIPDVNLLLYATVDSFPQHERARQWWEESVNEGVVGLAPPVVFGFLRLTTSLRVLVTPMPAATATGHVREWVRLPNVQLLTPGPEHLSIACDLIDQIGTAGNLTTDVQIATYAIEQQADVCSNDSDFARFTGLRWTNPLT